MIGSNPLSMRNVARTAPSCLHDMELPDNLAPSIALFPVPDARSRPHHAGRTPGRDHAQPIRAARLLNAIIAARLEPSRDQVPGSGIDSCPVA